MKLSLTLLLAVGLVAADDFLNVPVHDLVQEGDFPTKTQYKPNKPKKPCPTTLTVTAPVDCSGCTTTVYKSTATESVDCHGCKKLTSSTYYPPFAGLCPACVGGVQTVYNNTGTSTVTSCSTTPHSTPYAPEGLASKK